MTAMKYGHNMPEVNIKEELKNLDRNNFNQVNDLVIRILSDIMDVEKNSITPDLVYALIQDYMIDLINPDLLDFSEENSLKVDNNV
jgi:hypothetical protein